MTNKTLKIKFTGTAEGVPETISPPLDGRVFLIVFGGKIFDVTHVEGDEFRDSNDQRFIADAWVQYEDAS